MGTPAGKATIYHLPNHTAFNTGPLTTWQFILIIYEGLIFLSIPGVSFQLQPNYEMIFLAWL